MPLLNKGEFHVGSVGGETTIIDVVMTMPAEAIDDNDVMAATQEIALAMRVNGGTGVLQSILVQDDDDNASAFDIVIMDSNTSIGTEDAAVSMADNDTVLGIVSVSGSDYVDMINSQVATMSNLGIVVKSGAASQSLYVGTVTRDAATTSAAGMTLRFGFLQD